jgi:hypothetical protein
MNDIELTKACADVSGVLVELSGGQYWLKGYVADRLYDPLHDDAQCFALVKRFKLSIYQHQDLVTVTAYFHDGYRSERNINEVNHAIVECVAKLHAAQTEVE